MKIDPEVMRQCLAKGLTREQVERLEAAEKRHGRPDGVRGLLALCAARRTIAHVARDFWACATTGAAA